MVTTSLLVACLHALCVLSPYSLFSVLLTQTSLLGVSTIHPTLGMVSRWKEVIILVRPPSGAPIPLPFEKHPCPQEKHATPHSFVLLVFFFNLT